jgi:tetratricopeptide (TPR) repeat protein
MNKRLIWWLVLLIPCILSAADPIQLKADNAWRQHAYAHVLVAYPVQGQWSMSIDMMAGMAALLQGDAALALQYWQKIPSVPTTLLFWQGLAWYQTEQTTKALGAWQQASQSGIAQVQPLAQSALWAVQKQPFVAGSAIQRFVYSYVLMLSGQYADAIASFDVLVQNNVNGLADAAVYYQAESYRLMQRWTDAVRKYQTLALLYPNSGYVPQAWYQQALVADPQVSIDLLQQVLQSKASDSLKTLARQHMLIVYTKLSDTVALQQLWQSTKDKQQQQEIAYNIGLIFQGSDSAMAIKWLQLAQTPRDTALAQQANYAIAYGHSQLGQWTQVASTLQNYGLDSQSSEARIILALQAYREMGDAKTASQLTEQCLKQPMAWSGEVRAYLYLVHGWAVGQQSQLQQALADYHKVLKLTQQTAMAFEAQYRIGMMYSRRGEAVRAEAIFDELSRYPQLQPSQTSALQFAQAVTAYQSRQWSKAAGLARQATSRGMGQSDEWQRLLAAIKVQQEQYGEAAKIYATLATSVQPWDTDALYLSAINAYRAKQWRLSVDTFQQLVDYGKEPNQGQSAYFWQGKAYEMLGQWNNAVIAYAKVMSVLSSQTPHTAIRSVPTSDEVQYHYAFALVKSGQSEAVAFLNQLEASRPQVAYDIYYQLGSDEFNQKNYKDAARYFDKASRDSTRQALAWYRMGMSFELGQQTTPAIQAYQRYLQTYTQGEQAVLVARRLAQLADHDTLTQAIANGQWSIAVRAPLVLAWIADADADEKSEVQAQLQQLPLAQIEGAERSAIGLATGQYYQKIGDVPMALQSYDHALDLALSAGQYVQARKAKSVIYEKMGDVPTAIKEILLIEQTFRGQLDVGAQALYDAWLLSQKYQLAKHQQLISQTLVQRYPKSAQAIKIQSMK